MANKKITELTENTARHFNDLLAMVDDPAGTPLTQKMKFVNATGLIVNAQTGTTYTYLTGDYGKLVTHTNGSSIAGTLPQAGASFPANWFMFVQNRGAGVLTITPTTSTIDGAATLVLNQNEGALIVSDGTNYFTMRGKDPGTVPVSGSAFEMEVACSDESTALVTATGVATFRMPRAVTLTAVRASLKTAASSGTFTVDINEAGSTILSTKITIDATEKTSTTAATPPVISDSALADDAEMTVDIDDDAAGDAVGLKIVLIGTRA